MLGWYVVHSKPQKENWLYNQLSALPAEVYYPCLRIRNKRTLAYQSKPYFPRYLFVNVDLDIIGISTLKWIPGSLGLITFGGTPACVPDGLLQRIRHRVDEINSAGDKMREGFRFGSEVTIHSGPFTGFNAIFCARLRDNERAQVLLKVLEDQAIRINLPLCDLTLRQNKTRQ